MHDKSDTLVDIVTDASTASDAATVARVCAGEEEAFGLLVERHSRNVFRVAYRMTSNEQDAEDVVQETFLKAYRQIGRFESRASFGTWVYRIAINCAHDLMRQRPKGAATAVDFDETTLSSAQSRAAGGAPPDADRMVFSAEVKQRVTETLSELSQNERAAFVLRHFEGLSIEEVGRTLGLRTSATKHSIFRAVQKMRRALEPLVNSEPVSETAVTNSCPSSES